MMFRRLHLRPAIVAAGALVALLTGLVASAVAKPATAQERRCVSWSEARTLGLIDKFKLRPAKEIKARVEARYGGKVVSFVICESPRGLTYKMAVFKDNGNVTFVMEPAE